MSDNHNSPNQLTVLTCPAPDTFPGSPYNEPFKVIWNAATQNLSIFSNILSQIREPGSTEANHFDAWTHGCNRSGMRVAMNTDRNTYWAIADAWSKADIYPLERFADFYQTARQPEVLARYGNPFIPQQTVADDSGASLYLPAPFSIFGENCKLISRSESQRNYWYSDSLFALATDNPVESVANGTWEERAPHYDSGAVVSGMSIADMIRSMMVGVHAAQTDSAYPFTVNTLAARQNVILPVAYYELSKRAAESQGVGLLLPPGM